VSATQAVSGNGAAAGTPVYCDHCGGRLDAGVHDRCVRMRRLEPPRFCARCRRRMVVQVVPRGWVARCVEHGEITEAG
jgi:RecJ-like exonuclease